MKTLIIPILTIISLPTIGQTNKQCYEKVYQVTDTLPQLISKTEDILKFIKDEITIPDSLKNHSGFLFIKYVINCNGDIVNLRVIKTADSDGILIKNDFEFLSTQLFKILKKELKWSPARQGGKTVDFFQVCSITFDKGEISIKLTAT